MTTEPKSIGAFILGCHVAKLGHPIGVDPERFHLIAPYETDPRQWEKLQWIDQYSGKRYRITASGRHGSRTVARVKSYGDVLREYEFHPEAKCADSTGAPCSKQTIGLLSRRHIAIDSITYIGKESNRLEEVEEQSLLDPNDVYTEYPDPRRDEWAARILPKLKATPLGEACEDTSISRGANATLSKQGCEATRGPYATHSAADKAKEHGAQLEREQQQRWLNLQRGSWSKSG